MYGKFFFVNLVLLFIHIKYSETRPEPCKIDNDCKNLDSAAYCSKQQSCKCPVNKIISETGDKCVGILLFGDKCKENIQCASSVKGASCINGICDCINSNERYLKGSCKQLKYLGEACSVDEDCNFGYNLESVACDNKKKICTCAKGYYLRTNNICRKKVNKGGACIVHTDCDKLKCVNKVCGGKPKSKISVNILNKIMKNSNISTNYSTNVLKFGDQCTKNLEPCTGFENSICLENLCYCQLGYYLNKEKCMAELGEKARTKEFCLNEFDPKKSICKCKDTFFYEPNLRTCKKSIEIRAGCTSDSQCSPFAAKCIEIDSKKKCACSIGAELNEEQQICVDKVGIGASCDKNKPCKLEHTICNSKNSCVCKDNYFFNNEKCIPGIGADCLKNKDCPIKNSICLEHKNSNIKSKIIEEPIKNITCVCKDKFIHFNNTCLPILNNILANCTHTVQCESIESKCINNKCDCNENQHFRFGKCEIKKKLGEQCVRAGQCYLNKNINGVECRNLKCQCKFNYDIKDGVCFKSSSSILRVTFLLGIVLIFLLF